MFLNKKTWQYNLGRVQLEDVYLSDFAVGALVESGMVYTIFSYLFNNIVNWNNMEYVNNWFINHGHIEIMNPCSSSCPLRGFSMWNG